MAQINLSISEEQLSDLPKETLILLLKSKSSPTAQKAKKARMTVAAGCPDMKITVGKFGEDGKFVADEKGNEVLCEAKGFKSKFYRVADIEKASKVFSTKQENGKTVFESKDGKWYEEDVRHRISPLLVTTFFNRFQ